MSRSHTLVAGLAASALGVAGLATATPAAAHGSMEAPRSRTSVCHGDGAESPTLAACRAAVQLGGAQAVYDWHEVNIADAAGRHRDLIPDGELCSAGRDKYRGFDLARADWPTTSLRAGATFTFRYRATAPHRGGFELYLTRNGHDPTEPLAWGDLQPEPFLEVTDPPLVDGSYQFQGRIPAGARGRHVVYAIWQRSDSPEAFYSCSDVVVSGTGGGTTPTTRPNTPTTPTTRPRPTTPTTRPTTPTTRPTTPSTPGSARSWRLGAWYDRGDVVTYRGERYRCRQSHAAYAPDWNPASAPALWSPA